VIQTPHPPPSAPSDETMWTPDRINRHLQEEIRATALALGRERDHTRRVARLLGPPIRHIGSDPIGFFFEAVAVVAAGVCVTLIVDSWPLGGGHAVSQAVIAQGASLIFVTIVLGFVLGPAETGRGLGDATFINRDLLTWAGIVALAAISIFELWIGSLGPERAEELATFALTAAGIAAVAIVVRRLVRLSDPYEQLALRQLTMSRGLDRVLRDSRQRTKQALAAARVDDQAVAGPIEQIPAPAVEALASQGIQQLMAVSRTAWHQRDWQLAARAHGQATILAIRYANGAKALGEDDKVFEMLRNERADLYSLSSGADGRWLSYSIISTLTQLGETLVALRRTYSTQASPPSDSLAWSTVHLLDQIVVDRVADTSSPDIHAALTGIGRIAIAEANAGHDWGAAVAAARLSRWASFATKASRPEISWSAWEWMIAVLAQLATRTTYSASLSFGHLGDAFLESLRQLERLPDDPVLDPMAPVTGVTTGRSRGLSSSWYQLFECPPPLVSDVASFSVRVAARLVLLVEASADRSHNDFKSGAVAGVVHQSIAATVSNPSLDGNSDVTASVADRLGWLRRLFIGDSGYLPDHGITSVLHVYLSAWLLALYRNRESPDLSEPLLAELAGLLSDIEGLPMGDAPLNLSDGLGVLARSLRQVGHAEPASRVDTLVSLLSRSTAVRPYPSWNNHQQGWGITNASFFVYSGLMFAPVFQRVASFFGESIASDS